MEVFQLRRVLFCILIWTCGTDANNYVHLNALSSWSTFQSPNYPRNYPNDYEAMYYFYAIDTDNMICFEPVTFDLEDSVNCTKDYLSFQNSLLELPEEMWCGTTMTSNCSEDYSAFIRFRSNNNVTGKGFQIRYRQVAKYPEPVSTTAIVLVIIVVIVVAAAVASFCLHRRWRKQKQAPAVITSPTSLTLTPVSSSPAPAPYTPASDNTDNSYQDPPPSYDSLVLETKQ